MEASRQIAVLNEVQQGIYDYLLDRGWHPELAMEAAWQAEVDGAPEAAARFEVTDMSSANWVLKQIAETQVKMDQVNVMVEAEVRAIRAKQERLLRPIEQRKEFFEVRYRKQLEEWARRELEGQKSKSVALLHGRVGFRKSREKLVLDIPEDDVLCALREFGYTDCIRTTESVDRYALKDKIREQPLGTPQYPVAHVEPAQDTFYIDAEMSGKEA